MLCPKLKLPYTIGVLLFGLLAGALLSRLEGQTPLHLLSAGGRIGHELIIFVFLPALVFESAFSIKVHAFRKDIRPIILLAGPALLMCGAAMGFFMHFVTSFSWHWSMTTCLTFGALISATDPVAVVALLKELGAPKRLGLLIEGESLFNDGTSIVVFGVLLDILVNQRAFEPGHTLVHFLLVTLGGFALGLLIAVSCTFWMGRLFNDALVEISLTLVLAYATMLVVEGFLHLSGVMAVVAAGLWLSGPGRTAISPEVEHFLHRFWEMLSYLANTLIFFLVGLVVAAQGHRLGLLELGVISATYLGLMLIRLLVLAVWRPILGSGHNPVSQKESQVMTWGGLRGAVSLALALIIHQQESLPLVLREQILLVTAGVVFLTILINGTTLSHLLKRLGLDRPPAGSRLADLTARLEVFNRVRHQIHETSGQRDLRTVLWSEVESELQRDVEETERRLQGTRDELQQGDEQGRSRGFWRQAMNVERQAYWKAFGRGCLEARTAHILDQEVDGRMDLLEAGQAIPRPGVAPLPQEAVLRRLSRLGGPLDWLKFEALALRHDLARGQTLAAEAVLNSMEGQVLDSDVREAILQSYRDMQRRGRETLEDLRSNLPEVTRAIETRLARRVLLNLERKAYNDIVHLGALDPAAGEEAILGVEQRMKALSRNRQRMELPETADLVRETELFADLTEEELEKLAIITKEKCLSPGECLLSQGDTGSSLFIISRGAVLVYQDGLLIDTLGGGDMFGEISLLTGEPRSTSIQAATTVTLGEIARDDFEDLLAACPGLRERTWRMFARRRFVDFLRHDKTYQDLDHRERLAWLAKSRVEEIPAGQTRVFKEELVFLAIGEVLREQRDCPHIEGRHPTGGGLQAPGFLSVDETYVTQETCWLLLLSKLN